MKKFVTNNSVNADSTAVGTIASSTEVLANNLSYMQDCANKGISDIIGDFFQTGIVDSGATITNFPITLNSDGTFNVGLGVGYKYNATTYRYERIAITDTTAQYNSYLPTQTTYDGNGNYVSTPKSSGCANIPTENLVTNNTYWIDLQYLFVCDNGNTRASESESSLNLTNYSMAYDNITKRFYKWIDGYNIVLQDKYTDCKGLVLGTVVRATDGTVTIDATAQRSNYLIIKSSMVLKYILTGAGLTMYYNDVGYAVFGVNVDNVTTEVNANNQVRVTKDGLYPYTKFAVNSGYSSFLTVGETSIALQFGGESLWVNPAYNDRYEVTSTTGVLSLDNLYNWFLSTEYNSYNENPNGNYYTVFINKTARYDSSDAHTVLTEPTDLDVPILEIMKNIYVSSTAPTSTNTGDVWLDTSTQPYKSYWNNSGTWIIYHGVPLGRITFTNNIIKDADGTSNGYFQFEFNRDWSRMNEVGLMFPYSGNVLPERYLLCDGAPYRKLYYYELWKKCSNLYGTDTDMEFYVPNYQNRSAWGGSLSSAGTYIESALPDIQGTISPVSFNDSRASLQVLGAFSRSGAVYGGGRTNSDGSSKDYSISFKASSYNSIIYKETQEIVQPPSLQTPFIIRY